MIENNINFKVPRMRTVKQIQAEFPDTQMSIRMLRQLARENKVAHVYAGNKLLINVDSLFDFLNGKGAWYYDTKSKTYKWFFKESSVMHSSKGRR